MTQNLDINRIVEKVLDQIAQEARNGKPRQQVLPPAIAPKPKLAVTSPAANCDDELFVTDRVVSLGKIEKQLVGKKRLAITPGAVLTPSVRDYLKEHQISICTAMPGADASNQKSLTIIAGLTSYDPTNLVTRLTQERLNATASSSSCLIETTDKLAKQLADTNQLGVVLTTHHAVTLCLANRHATLRAVSVDREDQVESIVATVGANLLILSPRGRSCFQLQRMITRFLQMPSHACPEVLKARLA